MGTDIHGVFQRYTNEQGWEDVPSEYGQGRHYQLFAVLAGVRNGRGFAGARTGEAVKPIVEPRGLPDDFQHDGFYNHYVPAVECVYPWGREDRTKHPEDYDNPLEVWMGDHTHSFLYSSEMLEWFKAASKVLRLGVITLDEYLAWDKVSPPGDYCAGISGPGIRVVDQPDYENVASAEPGALDLPVTHIRVFWEQDLRQELAYFFDEVRRLQDLHGEVRFVFGFDS